MRHDMSKIITEPARRGVRYYSTLPNEYRRAKNFKLNEDLEVDDEFCAAILPMRSKHIGWDGKEQSYTINPIKRFLTSRIGDDWDNIYSEICKALKNDVSGRYELRDIAVRWNVETKTFIDPEDGEIYYNCRFRGATKVNGLFVHPITKKLCDSKEKSYKQIHRERNKKHQEELDKVRKIVSSEIQFHKIENVWYKVKLGPIPPEAFSIRADALGKIKITWGWSNLSISQACFSKYGISGVWAASKQTASKKDIRRYKLNKP